MLAQARQRSSIRKLQQRNARAATHIAHHPSFAPAHFASSRDTKVSPPPDPGTCSVAVQRWMVRLACSVAVRSVSKLAKSCDSPPTCLLLAPRQRNLLAMRQRSPWWQWGNEIFWHWHRDTDIPVPSKRLAEGIQAWSLQCFLTAWKPFVLIVLQDCFEVMFGCLLLALGQRDLLAMRQPCPW